MGIAAYFKQEKEIYFKNRIAKKHLELTAKKKKRCFFGKKNDLMRTLSPTQHQISTTI